MKKEDSFENLLDDDVTPLTFDKRVEIDKTKESAISQENRRKSAVESIQMTEDPLSSEPVEMVEPLSLLAFKRPGVQNGVYRNLRLGKYAIDARLDLHRMTVERARKTLFQFVKDCIANDVRSALVTHGKGEGREKPALLKSCVAHWLPQLDDVLAFHTAQKQHGSYGATYVLLKKSDKKKQESREAHNHR